MSQSVWAYFVVLMGIVSLVTVNYIGYDFDLTIMTAAGDITVTKGLSEFWTNLQPTDEHKKAFTKTG